MCVYTYIVHNIETIVGQKKIGTAVKATCQGNLSLCRYGHACHRFAAPLQEGKGARSNANRAPKPRVRMLVV